jgi:hypothetical protein
MAATQQNLSLPQIPSAWRQDGETKMARTNQRSPITRSAYAIRPPPQWDEVLTGPDQSLAGPKQPFDGVVDIVPLIARPGPFAVDTLHLVEDVEVAGEAPLLHPRTSSSARRIALRLDPACGAGGCVRRTRRRSTCRKPHEPVQFRYVRIRFPTWAAVAAA